LNGGLAFLIGRKEIKPMKRGILKISFAVAVFVILELFILTPAFAKLDCPKLVWEGDYYILTATDLESLSGYTSVTGTLLIHYPTLISLEGLECLTQVGGNLEIYENDSLTSLEGLDNLKDIGGNMRIYDNDSLISLEGLDKLKYVGGHMRIRDNDSLTNLEGLDKLKDVGGNMRIYDNDSLISLEGLDKLKFVGGHMRIRDNDFLTSLERLEKIKSVGSELEINNNDELCTSLAEALRDQLLNAGGIGGLITILDNNAC
jgi:receptor L domain-containing protein